MPTDSIPSPFRHPLNLKIGCSALEWLHQPDNSSCDMCAGFSYDWDREVSTTSPEYYKWTQWIFCQLFKRGLAYQAEVPVNWCPALGTVLANEEVIDGKSERGDHPVVRLPMKQVGN